MSQQGARPAGQGANRSAQQTGRNRQNENRSAQSQQQQGATTQQERGGLNRTNTAEQRQAGQRHLNAAEQRNQGERNNRAAEQRNREQPSNRTAEQHNGNLRGLQSNAALPMRGESGNVSLNDQQRRTIRDTVIDVGGAPRVDNVDFNLRVGAAVPRERIHAVRVPETLVRIHPAWRGYLYFVVRDEVVIVNPRDMRVVAVLTV
jgi:hypothetical protein